MVLCAEPKELSFATKPPKLQDTKSKVLSFVEFVLNHTLPEA